MNNLIDQLTALRLHGMAACAHDLLRAGKPPDLTTAIKQLTNAETVERGVRSISNRSARASSPKKPTISFWWAEPAQTKLISPSRSE